MDLAKIISLEKNKVYFVCMRDLLFIDFIVGSSEVECVTNTPTHAKEDVTSSATKFGCTSTGSVRRRGGDGRRCVGILPQFIHGYSPKQRSSRIQASGVRVHVLVKTQHHPTVPFSCHNEWQVAFALIPPTNDILA